MGIRMLNAKRRIVKGKFIGIRKLIVPQMKVRKGNNGFAEENKKFESGKLQKHIYVL